VRTATCFEKARLSQLDGNRLSLLVRGTILSPILTPLSCPGLLSIGGPPLNHSPLEPSDPPSVEPSFPTRVFLGECWNPHKISSLCVFFPVLIFVSWQSSVQVPRPHEGVSCDPFPFFCCIARFPRFRDQPTSCFPQESPSVLVLLAPYLLFSVFPSLPGCPSLLLVRNMW